MKHHLNVLIIALRVIIFALGVMVGWEVLALIGIIQEGSVAADEYFEDLFTPMRFGYNPLWMGIVFIVLNIGLIAYLIWSMVRLYRCFLKFEKGNVFYTKQAAEFRAIGAGIIIFAKSRYLLFCTMGAVVYFDLSVFYKQLIPFLAIYLIGKIFLVLSYVSETGEVLKEEHDLTV